jgi:hypothetical protein
LSYRRGRYLLDLLDLLRLFVLQGVQDASGCGLLLLLRLAYRDGGLALQSDVCSLLFGFFRRRHELRRLRRPRGGDFLVHYRWFLTIRFLSLYRLGLRRGCRL